MKDSKNFSSVREMASQKGLPFEIIVKRSLPYWPLFVIGVFVALASSFIYLRYTDKLYRVQSRLVVNDDDQEKSNSNLLRFQFDVGGFANEIEKEVEILKSRTLLTSVVKALNLQSNLRKEGNVKFASVYGNSAPIKVKLFDHELIRDAVVGPISYSNGFIKFNDDVFPIDTIVNSKYGRILFSVDSTYNGDEKLELTIYSLPKAVSSLKSSLSVTPIGSQSSIVDLVILELNPERGVDILNTLLQIYSNNYVEFKRRIAQNALNFVDERLAIISGELNTVEKGLEEFKSNEGVVDLSIEGQIFLNQVSQYDQDLAKIRVQLEILENLKKYVGRRNNSSEPVPATLGLEDPLLSNLLTQLFQAEFEYDKIKNLSGPKNPQLDVLSSQISKLKPSIIESINNLENSLLQSQKSILRASNLREGALKKIPKKERMLLDISRQQTIKNTIYTYLLQKREEAAIQSASIVPNNRIIDQPAQVGLERPKSLWVYVFSLFGFSLFVIIYVFVKEFANPRFLYKKEITEALDIPVVGELQHIPSKQIENGVVVKPNSRDIINEQFRELRTNISFLGKQGKQQVILFTSSKSGEGKSFVSINLALSLVQAGKKVVLIELDLRRPKILQYLSIPKGKGMSNYLTGISSLQDIIVNLKEFDGLSVIGSGPIPPNPSELLMQDRIADLICELRGMFDYILIDAPPVGIVTDARLLGQYSDICLYLIRCDYTERHFIELIDELKSNNILPSLNIVFNSVPFKRLIAYGYGYGYSNEYAYNDNSKKRNLFRRFFR